jgi:D-alanyl-lipoteichoic acid acyltransferase DltB (MBOAT superfamily)
VQFTTLLFAAFFLATLTVSWLLSRARAWQKAFLLLASYVFYLAGMWKQNGLLPALGLVAVLAASSLLGYVCGEGIARAESRTAKRAWLLIGLLGTVSALGFFKYYGFLSDALNDLLSAVRLRAELPVLELLLPVGISFYTFQGVSYLLDLYWKRGLKARSVLDYMLFVAFFPKLLSGPLCKARDFLAQIHSPAPAQVPEVTRAATLILSGLFKKVVLAALVDLKLVSDAFANPLAYSAPALWAALIGYGLLIYWDFSGYTDIAIGTGLLLGFKLPDNFNHPYIATDISDFWRRWHITLSMWLREYLFVPLGGLNITRRWSAVVLTMAIAGLWHGAGWTFILWGTYHGVLLFIHHGLRELKLRWKGGWLGRAGTCVLVLLGWVLFRAETLPLAGSYFLRLFSPAAPGKGFAVVVLPLLILGLLLQVYGGSLRVWYMRFSERLPWMLRPAFWLACGLGVLVLKPGGVPPYIYFGF